MSKRRTVVSRYKKANIRELSVNTESETEGRRRLSHSSVMFISLTQTLAGDLDSLSSCRNDVWLVFCCLTFLQRVPNAEDKCDSEQHSWSGMFWCALRVDV